MRGWLIYHPRRASRVIDGRRIHFDSTAHNQDPYIWNDRFLHSYCHITQMAPEVEDIEFWTTGDSFPNFTALYCDLVLVVEEKSYWIDANYISPSDPIVDSEAAYADHYSWAEDHPFHRRKRFTVKANQSQSFQPQDGNGELVDIVPGLVQIGLALEVVARGIQSGYAAKPMQLSPEHAAGLYDWIKLKSPVKLTGPQLSAVRGRHSELSSRQ
jgi:hypothetical protein